MPQIFAPDRVRIRRGLVSDVKRRIPYSKSKLKVAVGQEVTPEDILAECQIPSGFRVVHLAQSLGVNFSEGQRYLQREVGQNIYVGELLASKQEILGLKKRTLLSPYDGVIDAYDPHTGDLRIKFLPKIAKLTSGVYGIVSQIDPSAGIVTIRTLVDVIYSVFGSGQERSGTLRIVGSPSMLSSSRQINQGMEQQIVVAGGIVFSEAIKKAVSIGVSGIISGGINVSDYLSLTGEDLSLAKKRWSDVGITVLVTEGFGSVPIGEDIYPLLTFHQGKFAILQGNLGRIILPSRDKNSMMMVRKTWTDTSVLGDNLGVGLRREMVEIRVGSRVRTIGAPFLGSQGVVRVIDKTPTKLPSGVTAILVTVEGRTSKFQVPSSNLEIIE